MVDLFTEVDDAMKREKLEQLWQRYGGVLIALLVIIILGTAANAGYISWKTTQNERQTDLLLKATSQTTYNAEALLKIAPELAGNLRRITMFHAAGLSLEEGNHETAQKLYDDVAQHGASDQEIAQLASYVSISLSQDLTTEEKLSQLDIILSNDANPWRYHARLDAALLSANMHYYTQARTHIMAILNAQDIPQTLRQKAQSLDILYALKEKIEGIK